MRKSRKKLGQLAGFIFHFTERMFPQYTAHLAVRDLFSPYPALN
jgi:hypothetical protein